MKILIIGKGVEPESCPNASLALVFMNSPAAGEKLDMSSFDFVFYHLIDHTDHRKAKLLDDWRGGGGTGKVIAFSGGDVSDLPENVRNTLANLRLPFLPSLMTRPDVKALPWSRVPADFAGTATELADILRGIPSPLVALAVICKGFLITQLRRSGGELLWRSRGPNGQMEWQPASDCARQALELMGWPDLLRASESQRSSIEARLESRREETDKLEWWMEPLGDWLRAKTGSGQAFDETALKKEVEQRFGALPCKDTLALLRACHESTAPSVETVALAYLELAEMLGERPKSVRGPL